MKEYQSLSHTRWDCKYHVVFIPKRRKKAIYGALRRNLGEIFWELAQQRECKVVEGHLMSDHVYMCLSIPPKLSVSNAVGYIKGKSAISIARNFGGRQRNFTGEVFESCAGSHYWARKLIAFGHDVKLIAAQHARAYVSGNKNDTNDAAAIANELQSYVNTFAPSH